MVAIADEVAAAARSRQEREVAELEEAFGTGRGTGALRKRLETRHRRELRRVRFDAIRDSLADLLGAYRDMALLAVVPPGDGPGPEGSPGVEGSRGSRARRCGRRPGPARQAGTLTRLAAGSRPGHRPTAAAIGRPTAALAMARPLTLEAAFLSVRPPSADPPSPSTASPSAAEHQFARQWRKTRRHGPCLSRADPRHQYRRRLAGASPSSTTPATHLPRSPYGHPNALVHSAFAPTSFGRPPQPEWRSGSASDS